MSSELPTSSTTRGSVASGGQTESPSRMFSKHRMLSAADWIAGGILISLPWSTSVTSALILLWLLLVIPRLDWLQLWEQLTQPAAFLPVMVWLLAVFGMLWSDAEWSDKFEGLRAFHKLLLIPVLMVHFSRSERGPIVLGGFLASCVVLLFYSWASLAWPGLAFGQGKWGRPPGVPVKDSISQGVVFALSAGGLLHLAITFRQSNKNAYALVCLALMALFLLNVFYVSASRTAVIVFVVMALLIGYQRFGWRGAASLTAAVLLTGCLAWSTSSYFRDRMTGLIQGTLQYERTGETGEAQRLEFWRKSLSAIREAPIIGHGTGSIRDLFESLQVGTKGAAGIVIGNPHNQVFAVGIQLGVVGILILLLMWLSHLLLFRGSGLVAWLGTLVVVQNIVSSMFNSHLTDFTPGWMYVFGVGIFGGIVSKERSQNSSTNLEGVEAPASER
jgi:O-antigen ligase